MNPRRLALIPACFAIALTACGGTDGATTTGAAGSAPTTIPTGEATMHLTSTSFTHEGTIPARHTCDGAETSPPLALDGIPDGTVALAIVMDDPDAPGGTWDHWVAYDIPVTAVIPESDGRVGTAGRSTGGVAGYEGPCPPSGSHRYLFRAYALDTTLGLAAGADKAAVLAAMQGHVLAEATLMGRYARGS